MVYHRRRQRAQFPLGTAHSARVVHDRIEQRRAHGEAFHVVCQCQDIVGNLGVRRSDLQRIQLFVRRLLQIDRFQTWLPVRHIPGEFRDHFLHADRPFIKRKPAITRS